MSLNSESVPAVVTLRLEKTDDKEIRKLAEESGLNKSAVVRMALSAGLPLVKDFVGRFSAGKRKIRSSFPNNHEPSAE